MNLDRLRMFLSTTITPSEMSKELDELIFDFIIAYGDDAENHTLSPQEVSEHCFWLKELRDIFAEM
jgi:hypothetical protein|nr:MAG TPA: hypothetical protein [Caudoviricetes sp.]